MFEGPRIAFFGTSEISVIALEHLLKADLAPQLIVTQPDRPKGRHLTLTPSPVKVWADAHNIPTIQPESFTTIPTELTQEWDVFVVVSYGRIIPQAVLDLSKSGALNIHPSLLPILRGPSPIQSAICTDQRDTGVTLMQLDEKMDHGPIVSQASITLEEWPVHADVLEELLGNVGAELLTEALIPWINGDLKAEEQDHDSATYCSLIKKEDARIDLQDDPYQNVLKIHAYSTWPVAYFLTEKDGKEIRVKVLDAECKDKQLHITRVIPEGKKEMSYEDFQKSMKKSA